MKRTICGFIAGGLFGIGCTAVAGYYMSMEQAIAIAEFSYTRGR